MLLCGITVIAALTAIVTCVSSGVGLHWLWTAPLSFVGSFLGLVVAVFLFLLVSCLFVDQNKPQEKDSRFYRMLVDLCVPLVLTVGQVRVHTKGLEQTPKSGRFLLVCNHLHEADPVILLKYFRKSQLAFISKRENDRLRELLQLCRSHPLRCRLSRRHP